MATLMLVNCSGCRTPLQLPPGARSIRCALCHAVTSIADPRSGPPPSSSPHPHSSFTPSPPPSSHLPSPYQLPPPSSHGRRKAVICGISYRYSRHELKGCINDAKCMRHLLINKFHFPPDSILMLTEEETDPYRIPTKHNMRMALYWLVQGCQPGDSLLFHYSGHGSRQRNYNGDEVDGYDETLCPLDFETQGMIVDDEINATIVRPLPHGVKLHAIIDACHSGTVLDLSYLCRMNSGCDDDQTSADTSALSKITSTGAMTFCFIQAIERGQGATYGSILNSMRSAIRATGNDLGGGAVTSVITMLLTGGSVGGGLRQ
ncbi:AMC1 [Linum perenne]